jgi:hypothetical protein
MPKLIVKNLILTYFNGSADRWHAGYSKAATNKELLFANDFWIHSPVKNLLQTHLGHMAEDGALSR